MRSWHGPQAKPSLLWWGPSDKCVEPCSTSCSFANSTKGQLVTRITRSPNAVDRAFDTAYSALWLWEQREKHDAYHFFFYKPITALAASSSGSSGICAKRSPTRHGHNSLAFAQKIVGAVRRGYLVQSPGQRHALVLFNP